jgi:hypothetical protein
MRLHALILSCPRPGERRPAARAES